MQYGVNRVPYNTRSDSAMPSIRFILVWTVLAGLCACSDKGPINAVLQHTTPAFGEVAPAIPYLLKKQTFEHPGATNGQTFFYFYNASHRIREIQRIIWTTSYVNGQRHDFIDTSYWNFEYDGAFPVRAQIIVNGRRSKVEYDYADNLLRKSTTFATDGSVQNCHLYDYDGENNLVQVRDSSNRVNYRDELEYEGENLRAITRYQLWSTPQKISKYEFGGFDGKHNFIKAVRGLPETYMWHNTMHSYSSSSPNNFREQRYYVPRDIDKGLASPRHSHYSYTYNSAGLPLEMRYAGWTVTFEYERF